MRASQWLVAGVLLMAGRASAAPPVPSASVSGAIFEETAAGRAGRPGVQLTLYRERGEWLPDGKDDRRVASATSDADGRYAFARVAAGRYWLSVDSRTLKPAAGLNPAAASDAVWAEQVAGPAGALCGETPPRSAAGPCFAGRRGSVSDDASALATSEHVAALTVAGAALSGLDFVFSFDVVTDVRDGDDDPKAERSQQGSLRQAFQNAGAIQGANALRFVPAVPPNSPAGGARFWTVSVASGLPELNDAGTSLDGAARDAQDPARVLDTNPGTLGAVATLGGAPLQNPARPELELQLARGLVVSAQTTLQHLAFAGSGFSVGGVGDLTLEDATLGVRADGTRPGPGSLVGVSVRDRASASLARVLIADQKLHGLLTEGEASLHAEDVEIVGSGGEFKEGSGATFQAPGSQLSRSLLHGNRRGVVLEAGANAIVESRFEANQAEGLVVRRAGNRLARNSFVGNGVSVVSEVLPLPGCAGPVITSAEVGLAGQVRVAGVACPGDSVELYRGEPRPATPDAPAGLGPAELEYVDAVATSDCGVFVLTLPGLPLDSQLTAAATSASGHTSSFSAPRGLTLSQAPEAVVETAEGSFVIRLLPGLAPTHVKHFIETALRGGFDGTLFHRSVAGELIQGGDPLSRDSSRPQRYGSGGLGLLKAEFSDRCFSRGVVGAVRCPSNCDTAGSQFFVCLTDHPELVGHYTAFGEVLAGLDVVERISRASVEGQPRIAMKVTIRQPRSF